MKLKVVCVDDEEFALRSIVSILEELPETGEVNGFQNPDDAFEYINSNSVDMAFLDIEMFGMNGLQLAKKIKEISPKINIVFVTGYSNYAIEAMSIRASGYVLKPIEKDAIENEILNMRNPVGGFGKGSTLTVKTFGNFEVTLENEPVHFPRSKAKEMFAYLVHKNGTGCSMKELAAVLFEDREYTISLQKQMQTIVSTMMKTLKDIGCGDVVIKKYNSLSVDTTKIDCDYYRFLKWDADAVNSYMGEYMANYEWAEFTVGFLDRRIK